jgi:hypothetical protein
VLLFVKLKKLVTRIENSLKLLVYIPIIVFIFVFCRKEMIVFNFKMQVLCQK